MRLPPFLRGRGLELAALATLAIVLGTVASCSYSAGKDAGRIEAPALERKKELEQLRQGIIERDRARQLRDARIAKEREDLEIGRQALAAAAAAHQVARRRVVIVDSSSAIVDGILEQLPVPVVQLTQASDARIRADSLQIGKLEQHVASLEARGDLWQAQAADQKRRGDLLEQDLRDEKRRGRWARIRDVAIAGAVGAAGGVLLAR
jgi:hypothetical protein